MRFSILLHSFGSRGGGYNFGPLCKVLSGRKPHFGTAIEEVVLTIYFRCSEPYERQPACHLSLDDFKEFHAGLADLPKCRFLRKRRKLHLDASGDFATGEEVDQTDSVNPVLQYSWQVGAHAVLVQELSKFETKLKPSEDFRFDEFLKWVIKAKSMVPKSESEMKRLADKFCDRT